MLIENSGQRCALEIVILQNVKYLHTANWKEFYIVGKKAIAVFCSHVLALARKLVQNLWILSLLFI
jgi:hypothetical protein